MKQFRFSVRPWCPTCKYFSKPYGVNNCELADWRLHPVIRNERLDAYIRENSDPAGTISAYAPDCPCWVYWRELPSDVEVRT
jgi:hypothetical protein